ncbi:E3 ubiquitin-protein ligase RNF4-like [Quillaja saponaria]|uniref:E3 ubiquitin-protein ligase RNF4-like n=1 Tax=Quillaja saponaria TaxID=32244 RepID=A0AAD7PVE6_QUISA|nr:E3 ubiquitin-protein ligase RNF4-like [Quillaja saponaria]
MVPGLDLNFPPSEENSALTSPRGPTSPYNENVQVQPTHDSELNDDVVIISPRKFEEARNNSLRKRSRESRGIMQEAQNDFSAGSTSCFPSSQNENGTLSTYIVDLDLVTWLISGMSNPKKATDVLSEPPSKPCQSCQPLPEAPSFKCAICMDQLIEETSTKCGHIFCKKCIEKALALQKNCPTCRRKLRKTDIFRIYLPTD